jgi:hypothetical protein
MAQIPAFQWFGNQAVTPQNIAARRKVAEALAASSPNPQTFWEGLQNATGKVGGAVLDWKAGQDEAGAQSDYAAKLAALGDNPSRAQLEQLAGDPFANQGQSAVVQALLSSNLKNSDPDTLLDRRYKQAQIDALGVKQSGFAMLSPEEITQNNLDPSKAYQRGPDGKIDAIGSGGVNVTVDNGDNSGAFNKKADQEAATRMSGYVSDGNDAQLQQGDLSTLADLAKNIGTGKDAEFKAAIGPYAQALGIDVGGLGEMQAYQSIVDKMAPRMRPTGSGSSSDSDVRMFLNALPSLGKTPEGNAILTQTFQSVADQKVKAAEIASQAFSPNDDPNHISWQEADKRIRALGDPYSAFKKATGKSFAPRDAATAPAPDKSKLPIPQTPDDFNQLKSGDHYIDPDDGKEYVKP